MHNGSITVWLDQMQCGDPAAAQQLWERYFKRLVGLARAKLRGAALGIADEEDIALSAFDSFFRRAEQGRFPQLSDRDDLWRLLVAITVRKAGRLLRDEQREKRGGNLAEAANREPVDIDSILSQEPSPQFAAEIADECRRLLDLLGQHDLQEVALRKMEGYTVDEIADQMSCTPRTIARRLVVIRELWKERG